MSVTFPYFLLKEEEKIPSPPHRIFQKVPITLDFLPSSTRKLIKTQVFISFAWPIERFLERKL